MAFDFDQPIDRRHSDSLKWQKYGDRDILPLWIADTDFHAAPCITDALQQRIKHGVFGYGVISNQLKALVVERMASRYQWQIAAESVVFLPGVVCGLNLCVRAFTKPQQSTLAPTPVYPPFRTASAMAERTQLTAPLRLSQQRWLADWDAVAPQLTGAEKLLMLCNPMNPGGTVYRRDELQAQLQFAQRHDLLVCSDEIHCDLVLEPGVEHIPFASLSEDAAQRSITLMSPSKSFNIAGLGASVAIIPNPQLRARFQQMAKGIVPDANVLALVACDAAWRNGQPWLDEQLVYLRANRDRLSTHINALPGLHMVTPEATFLGWIDARELNLASPAKFFEQHGLGLTAGTDFGDPGFVRINFGCRRALLEQALQRFTRAINALS